MSSDLPLVVIVGPTASGKTNLAVKLAKQFHGEVISADSRAIYKGLDIGTAKPTMSEREGVPHWGIDLVEPDQRFTAADFQAYARQKIQEIRARNHTPFLVGGTGLYVDSVVYEFEFPAQSNDVVRRKEFEIMSLEELHKYCSEHNIILPENKLNKRYVVNNIMRDGVKYKRKEHLSKSILVVGIATEKQHLWKRIAKRAEEIWHSGLVAETRHVVEAYGWDQEALTGNTYRIARLYIEGTVTAKEAIERLTIADRQLAKRQLTWLRRNEHITWLTLDEAYTYLAHELEARSIS